MTGQTLLDIMELLNAELQLQAGEEDVTKGLLALNIAQDYFESVAAQRAGLFQGVPANVTANSETTSAPTGLLRLDKLQYIDPATSMPSYDLEPLREVGGHIKKTFLFGAPVTAGGTPKEYWFSGTTIYWSPTPTSSHTIRYYGFTSKTDITASGTFLYDDIVALPIASFATRLIKSGLEDDIKDLASLALETFSQTLDAIGNKNRDGAPGLAYTQIHAT